MMERSDTTNIQYSIFNLKFISYKVAISIIFGLLGFAVNFYPVDFVFYGSYRMSFLFGLLFPMLITLSWGWKYGLLSALCGGCQTMWILWLPQSGYGPLVSVPPFTLWIVWFGWFSRTRHNIYLGEIIFRIFNTVLLYTVFRWVFTLNVPPHNVGIPLTVVHSIVFKELVNGLLILFIAQALLHLGRVRTFFKLPKSTEDPRLYYTYTNSVILGGILIFGFVGERYIWGMWGPESQNVARILGSLLLLLLGITCTYFTANVFAKKKTEELILAGERLKHFRKAVDSSSDAIGMSTPEGRHYYQNEVYNKLFGLNVEEVQGVEGPLSTVYANEKVGREVFETIMRGDSWNGEVKMLDKDSHEIDIYLRAYSIKDEKGKVIGLVGVHTDITERKQAEEELAKHRDHLEELVKKRTKELKEKNKELERFNNLFTGREFRIKELKDKVKKLEKK